MLIDYQAAELQIVVICWWAAINNGRASNTVFYNILFWI